MTTPVAFLAIIPLEWLVEWAGDEMAHYLGKDFGDLLIVTLHKYIGSTPCAQAVNDTLPVLWRPPWQ